MSLAIQDTPQVARRDVAKLLASCSVLLVCPANAAFSGTIGRKSAVVGFHNDAPWLDPWGTDLPYLPPIMRAPLSVNRESLLRLGHFL